ncbi:hypothetical protein AAG570_010833 [Ranatra chinensis]|uniref:Serpin domain-containing protein n=1 Tax=Ranatra chinensis TaxID=642074 RepID=A0ABD0YJ37_9HEMI
MVFVLPDDRNGLDLVVKDLPFVQLISLLEGLDTTEVAVTIPKFSLEFDLQMVPLLKKVGIIDIFEEKANLKGMFAQDVKAQISAIIHKAKISVNEKGTEAGAGTASHVVPLMIHEAEQFIADHQFLFFITDFHTGFLFAGAFLNPDETKTSNQGGGKVDAEGPLLSFPEMSSSAPTRRPQPMAQPSSSTAKPPRRTGNVGYQGQISSRPYPLPPRHQNTNQKDTINFSG